MKVSRILQHKGGDVATVTPETPVIDIVAQLRERRIGAMVVVDPDGRICGIISERDIVRALAEHGADLLKLATSDLMTRDVSVCSTDTDIDQIMRQMTEGAFRHVPVVEDGRLIGIVSIGDVVKARIRELEQEKSALQHYIAG